MPFDDPLEKHLTMPSDMKDEETKLLIKGAVAEALHEVIDSLEGRILSQEECEWIRLAMKAAARKEEFQEKIISSTATGAIWVVLASVFGGIMLFVKEYAIAHSMWRP